MRCVVTGAAGYVAGFVIPELERAHELTLFTRQPIESPHRVVTGDFLSEHDCLRALEGAEAVVHLGAVPSPSPETFAVNVMSTYRILDAARHHGVRRVVMASTNCVYGQCFRLTRMPFAPTSLPIDEIHPCRPEDNYGLSKIVSEEILSTYARAYGIEVAALRLAWVWGPREYDWWQSGGRDQIDRFAEGLWAYVDAHDAARAFRLATGVANLPADGAAYNINAAGTMAAEGSAEIAARVLPHLSRLAGDLPGRSSFFSAKRARDTFGWESRHSWEERCTS